VSIELLYGDLRAGRCRGREGCRSRGSEVVSGGGGSSDCGRMVAVAGLDGRDRERYQQRRSGDAGG